MELNSTWLLIGIVTKTSAKKMRKKSLLEIFRITFTAKVRFTFLFS